MNVAMPLLCSIGFSLFSLMTGNLAFLVVAIVCLISYMQEREIEDKKKIIALYSQFIELHRRMSMMERQQEIFPGDEWKNQHGDS